MFVVCSSPPLPGSSGGLAPRSSGGGASGAPADPFRGPGGREGGWAVASSNSAALWGGAIRRAAAVSGVREAQFPRQPGAGGAIRRGESRRYPSQAKPCLASTAGHRARLVWRFVTSLDLQPFYGRIGAVSGRAGRPPVDPRILGGLWLLATMEGVGSARALARQASATARAAREREERIERALEQREEAAKRKSSEEERQEARASTTDPEARVMKMGDGGFRPAVNGQFAVDTGSKIVVGVDATQPGGDSGQLGPMLGQLRSRHRRRRQRRRTPPRSLGGGTGELRRSTRRWGDARIVRSDDLGAGRSPACTGAGSSTACPRRSSW